jgi:hypothetical protein
MSEKELIEYIQQNLEHSPMIDTETGISAVQKLAKIAEKEKISWALGGGIALHLYGSPRLTKDVDVISEGFLSLEGKHRLTFGGISYEVKVGKKTVTVEWIVRSDDYVEYYRQALQDAVELPNGLKILTPEWLVILKSIAGRPKKYCRSVAKKPGDSPNFVLMSFTTLPMVKLPVRKNITIKI